MSRRPPPGACALCGIARGVSPATGHCDDCARRQGELPPHADLDDASVRMLAVSVIRQAISDVATHVARHGHVYQEHTAAGEARAFLLEQVWQPGNLWGEVVADLLQPSLRVQMHRYVLGLQVRRFTGGQRLKRPHAAGAAAPALEPEPAA